MGNEREMCFYFLFRMVIDNYEVKMELSSFDDDDDDDDNDDGNALSNT